MLLLQEDLVVEVDIRDAHLIQMVVQVEPLELVTHLLLVPHKEMLVVLDINVDQVMVLVVEVELQPQVAMVQAVPVVPVVQEPLIILIIVAQHMLVVEVEEIILQDHNRLVELAVVELAVQIQLVVTEVLTQVVVAVDQVITQLDHQIVMLVVQVDQVL
jgi:hypothetical protein